MRQEMMGVLGMAVASAGPYANNLHLAPDRRPHQHLINQFYRPDALPGAQPTVSKHCKGKEEGKGNENKSVMFVYVSTLSARPFEPSHL